MQGFCRLLAITEQSLKLGKGIIALVFAMPCSAGVVILTSIMQALLFACVRTLLGFTIRPSRAVIGTCAAALGFPEAVSCGSGNK